MSDAIHPFIEGTDAKTALTSITVSIKINMSDSMLNLAVETLLKKLFPIS